MPSSSNARLLLCIGAAVPIPPLLGWFWFSKKKASDGDAKKAPMTFEAYLALKARHPVISHVDRDAARDATGSIAFNATRVAWLGALAALALAPSLASSLLRALRSAPLLGALVPAGALVVRGRLLATSACAALTSLRQLLQNNYISANGNNFGLAPALMIGLGVPAFKAALTVAGACTYTAPFGTWQDGAGLGLFLLGAALETGSELQRKAFKAEPANKGKIFTGGLFSLARHINYTGEVLWYAGFALLATGSVAVSAGVATMLASTFALAAIPELGAHMQLKYREQWERYCAQTPYVLVPLIY